MAIEEQLLVESLRSTFSSAEDARRKLSDILQHQDTESANDPENYELNEAQDSMKYWIEKAFRDLAILSERLNAPIMAREILKSRKGIKHLDSLIRTDYDVSLHSEPLALARSYFDPLEVMVSGGEISGITIFETILHNTAKIIKAAGIEPKKETQVYDEVYKVVEFAFRDATRSIELPKSVKTYKPDIGVRSLHAAVEYKYADTKEKVKVALDAIYSDMRTYAGHTDWRTFYGVIYMTGPFYTQKDIEHEWRLLRTDISWTPIVIVGPGGKKASP